MDLEALAEQIQTPTLPPNADNKKLENIDKSLLAMQKKQNELADAVKRMGKLQNTATQELSSKLDNLMQNKRMRNNALDTLHLLLLGLAALQSVAIIFLINKF